METTGYETLGTLATLDSRVHHLRATIEWAINHPTNAQYNWSGFREFLVTALEQDEAYEMNRLFDERRKHAENLELAKRQLEAVQVIGTPEEGKF